MSGQATSYQAMPSLSPYVGTDRYDHPKEDHKLIAEQLRRFVDVDRPMRVGDLGCGNGELIYFLKSQFPHWEYSGFDYTQAFIDAALSFEGLAGVEFRVQDLLDITETFEGVLCTGVANIFPDVGKLLDKLLSVCETGGWVFVDGLFNRHAVDVRVTFRDNSFPESQGLWRTAFNQHSRESIAAMLRGRVRSFEFVDMIMDKELPFDPAKPAVNSFTFRAADGRNVITNGLNLIVNRTLLAIEK